MAELYLLCGTVGSGKTTYARNMELAGKAVHFSADEWMLHFYGEVTGREEFEKRLKRCSEMIFRVASRFLDNGLNVVLDFGFWKRADRDAMRERFQNHSVKLIYLKCTDQELRRRLKERNANLNSKTYEITEEMYEQFSSWFEPPTNDERPTVVES